MNDVNPDNEAMIDLDRAELVVPLDAIVPQQRSPVRTDTIIDPVEFFGFLDNFPDWPTNGLRLAELAERQGYSGKLVRFFEGLPGSFVTEADIMPYAEDASKPPFGQAIAQAPETDTEDPGGLTITDITRGTR